AFQTPPRVKSRRKQRTVSPQPSTSKHLSKRTLPPNDDDEDDIELIDPPPNPPSNTVRPRKEGKGKASESRPNGKVLDNHQSIKPESRAKGKAPESRAKDGQVKPKPVKLAAKKPPSDPSIEEASNNDDDRDPEHMKPPPNPRIDKELERWKSKVKDLEDQRDKLSQQLEELFQVRKTDAEQALDDLTALYESRSKTQESLISALQAQLASQPHLFRTSESGPNSSQSTHPPPNSTTSIIPHFLTRATADAEQHMLQDELARLRDELTVKGALVKERERRITELEQGVKDVRIELDAEIARSKELFTRQPPPQSHHSRSNSDPKHAAVIRFYEDFSNLLVLGIKFEQRGGVQDDILYTCMYTYVAAAKDEEIETWEQIKKTITFSLRVYTDLSLGDGPEPDRRVKYTPMELDKLGEDIKEHLGFLASGFTFPHNQASLFLGSLARQLESAFEEDKTGDVAVVEQYERERAEIIEVDDP
ncbi:hypothetical protein M405DRAFT_832591, partial [Rhizopogon salebrosus TDB-379]